MSGPDIAYKYLINPSNRELRLIKLDSSSDGELTFITTTERRESNMFLKLNYGSIEAIDALRTRGIKLINKSRAQEYDFLELGNFSSWLGRPTNDINIKLLTNSGYVESEGKIRFEALPADKLAQVLAGWMGNLLLNKNVEYTLKYPINVYITHPKWEPAAKKLQELCSR